MHFAHAFEVWRDYPELTVGVVVADGITATADVSSSIEALTGIARSRLAVSTEAEFPEIRAWRRVYAKMGLKPTQYRCAAEALLRRYRHDQTLPRIHPLIDLCNAISLAYAIPIAVFDLAKIAGYVEVRYATGAETYHTLSGETELPRPGEVIYADAQAHAHARRWTNRQSGYSAVSDATRAVLIVAEAVHTNAADDVARVVDTLTTNLTAAWSCSPQTGWPTSRSPTVFF